MKTINEILQQCCRLLAAGDPAPSALCSVESLADTIENFWPKQATALRSMVAAFEALPLCRCSVCGDIHTWRAPLYWDPETAWLHYVSDPSGQSSMNKVDRPAYHIMRMRWFNDQLLKAREAIVSARACGDTTLVL